MPPPQAVVVTGRRGAPVPKAEPIEYFRRHCFDANRRTGHSMVPDGDPDWKVADESLRERLKLSGPQARAFVLTDRARAHQLLLVIEEIPRPDAVIESRCTLIVGGGTAHARLKNQMTALFYGAGTERQVGDAAGYEAVPGWRQWLWSAMPERRSRAWQAVQASGAAAAGGPFVIVTDMRRFYDTYDYVAGDLKTKTGVPLSVLTLACLHRAGR